MHGYIGTIIGLIIGNYLYSFLKVGEDYSKAFDRSFYMWISTTLCAFMWL